MSNLGYVIAAWSIAGIVLGGYTVRLSLRVRRAERANADSEPTG